MGLNLDNPECNSGLFKKRLPTLKELNKYILTI
jgi:hypothetical protein